MNAHTLRPAFALLFATAACLSQAAAKDTPADAPSMSPEQQEMMKRFAAYAAVGPEHALLAKRAGSWDYTIKIWMVPGAPPEESAGTCESKLILGGRFIQDIVTGQFQGQAFSGIGIAGYDNIKKKYVATWLDSMGTGLMTAEGTASPDGKTLTYASQYSCPILNGTRHSKTIETYIDDDHWTMESYEATPDGGEFKMMEIKYTRRK